MLMVSSYICFRKCTWPVISNAVSKLNDFLRSHAVTYTKKSGNISEIVQDRDVVTTDPKQEVIYSLFNCAISNDLSKVIHIASFFKCDFS